MIPKQPNWLTLERAQELFIYDPETGDIRLRKKTHLGTDAGYIHISRGMPYLRFKIKGERLFAHTIAFFLITGIYTQVDHKNRDTLNHKWDNLRAADDSQNKYNGKVYRNSQTGFRGVSKFGDKFRASISVNKQRLWLGDFYDIEDAKIAYKNASIAYHGEFSHHASENAA